MTLSPILVSGNSLRKLTLLGEFSNSVSTIVTMDGCSFSLLAPGRECDGSETPLYLFLTRKNDVIVRIFRVEVGETVFCITRNLIYRRCWKLLSGLRNIGPRRWTRL